MGWNYWCSFTLEKYRFWRAVSRHAPTSVWVASKHFGSVPINFSTCSSVPSACLWVAPSLTQSRNLAAPWAHPFHSVHSLARACGHFLYVSSPCPPNSLSQRPLRVFCPSSVLLLGTVSKTKCHVIHLLRTPSWISIPWRSSPNSPTSSTPQVTPKSQPGRICSIFSLHKLLCFYAFTPFSHAVLRQIPASFLRSSGGKWCLLLESWFRQKFLSQETSPGTSCMWPQLYCTAQFPSLPSFNQVLPQELGFWTCKEVLLQVVELLFMMHQFSDH